MKPIHLLSFLCTFSLLFAASAQAQEKGGPAQVAGVSGGLCLYFDADEKQITDVVNSGSFLVHALHSDAKKVKRISAAISKAGLAPFVCVEAWAVPEIPYKKNHINLLVADDLASLIKAGVKIEKLIEIMAPLSKACLSGIKDKATIEAALKKAGVSHMEWKGNTLVFQKPWLEGMGTWTQGQRTADGNAVGNDVYLGVPNQTQWISSGNHRQARVAAGRAYYDQDDHIVVRDAGSGVLLWKKKINHGGIATMGDDVIFKIPKEGDKRRYVGEIVVADGSTGEIKSKIPGGAPKIYDNDVAISEGWSSYTAVQVSTGKKLWEIKYKKNGPDSIASNSYMRGGRGNAPQHAMLMKDGKVCARRKNGEMMAMDAMTGEVLWKRNIKEEMGAPYSMHFLFDDKIFIRTEKIKKEICVAGTNMEKPGPVNLTTLGFVALSMKDGSVAWKHEFDTLCKAAYRGQVYKANGLIWVGHTEVLVPDDLTATDDPAKNDKKFRKYTTEPDPMVFDGLNLKTGKQEKTITIPAQINYHCYQLTVTDRYHTGNRPYYFVSWETGEVEGRFGVVRSPCDGVGHFAAQGLFFARGMKGCGCIRTAMEALGAFSSSDDGSWDGAVAKAAHPLEMGSAKAGGLNVADTDWPTIRGDHKRSAASKAVIADGLKQSWHFKAQRGDAWRNSVIADDWARSNFLGKKIVSQPVIAGGVAFISQLENKAVTALDLKTGKEKWTVHVPARVDAAPSITHGLALVGCADGWVYALNADNGEQVYRLRIAPAERRIVGYGQLESSWPVVGGVLVVGDMAYAVAGRTTEIDGGLYVVGFDIKTGKLAWEGRRYLNNPGNIGKADHARMKNYGTGAADILTSDGNLIAIGSRAKGKHQCFDAKTGKDGGKYTAVPYATPLQSKRHRSVISVFGGKSYTAVAPTWHKLKKGEEKPGLNKPGHVMVKNGWKLSTEDGDAVAISGGADRLAVAVAKEGKNELWIVSSADGKKLASYPLPSTPTQDGIAVAQHSVLVTLEDGGVIAFAK